MSVRAERCAAIVRRGVPLQQAERVGHLPVAEHDVYDSRGEWFGTATGALAGAVFSRPPELWGVRVAPPFTIDATPNAARLAASLGAALSRALLYE